jgi:hypothetical protein
MGLHILYTPETNEYVTRLLATSFLVSLVGKAREGVSCRALKKKQTISRRLQGGEKKAIHEMHYVHDWVKWLGRESDHKPLYNEWGYNSKPLRECTENLNGRSAPARVRSAHAPFKWLHQAWCVRTIKVNLNVLN